MPTSLSKLSQQLDLSIINVTWPGQASIHDRYHESATVTDPLSKEALLIMTRRRNKFFVPTGKYPTVDIFGESRPRSHTHDTSHLGLDPEWIPHRTEPNAFINGSRLLRGSFIKSHRSRHDPSSSEETGRNFIDTSRVPLLPTARLNGLVESVMEAHGYRRRLVLAPDEVFACIISQFSYAFRRNDDIKMDLWQDPEILQSRLKVDVPEGYTRQDIPFEVIYSQLKKIFLDNLRNKDFASWIDPEFSTTTETHRLMYLTLFLGQCRTYDPAKLPPAGNANKLGGIVAATLKGKLQDWEKLLTLIAPLKKYLPRWHAMLNGILDLMACSYREPNGSDARSFWIFTVLRDGTRYAAPAITGWLSAFCLWSRDGTPNKEDMGPTLLMRGARYKRIYNEAIPPAYASVDIELRQREANGEVDCDDSLAQMVAGVFGTRYRTNGELPQYKCWPQAVPSSQYVGVQPFSAWFLFQVTPEHLAAREREREAMPSTN